MTETFNTAMAFYEAGRIQEAIRLCKNLLATDENHADAWYLLGVLMHGEAEISEAILCYRKTLSIAPDHLGVYSNLGAALQHQGEFGEAAGCYEKALARNPSDTDAYNNLGTLFELKGMPVDAEACYREILKLAPGNAKAYYTLGNALKQTGRIEEAAQAFEKAVSIRPDYPDAWNNLGIIRQDLGDMSRAVRCYAQAIEADPAYATAHYNLGIALEESGDIENAIAAYEKTLTLKADTLDAWGRLIHLLQHVCDWEKLEPLRGPFDDLTSAAMDAGIRSPETPFMSLTMHADLARNLSVSRSWSAFAKKQAGPCDPFSFKGRSMKKKITIGYLSNSFRNHPGAHLIRSLFGVHDREAFAVNCYSYGRDDGSYYRKRIMKDCDAFVDIDRMSTVQAAKKIHEDRVDILVDLRGHTQNNRIGICALRPAPIQVNFLGFPCTTGADFMDYMIVDSIVAPQHHAPYYSEQLVTMPHSYQVNDNTQEITRTPWKRLDMGLPEHGVVFASFNTAYKFEPTLFRCWMRILKQVDRSVLWLLGLYAAAEKNLKQAALADGVSAERIIFAEKLPKAEHLDRLKMADLVLDTRICNGHTSTTDALWAGVPVISILGAHFASRVSASLLTAVGLPELIAPSLEEYESLAVALGKSPERRIRIRDKLAEKRLSEPLFDTPRFVNNLEKAYRRMWALYISGELPKPIFIHDTAEGTLQ